MSQPTSPPAVRLPAWLLVLASAVVFLHLTGIANHSLASTSGPWPTMEGPSMMAPPQFAMSIDGLYQRYLEALKLTHTYHFATNRPGLPKATFEVRLKDAAGQVVATVKVPDEKANPWVRHRQGVLAQWLGDDQPLPPPLTEVIAAPQQRAPTTLIWDAVEQRRLVLKTVPEHLAPRDRPVMRPSEWSMLMARSYGRYLCRQHNAASAELVRTHRDPIPPAVLFLDNVQAGAFDPVTSEYGELPK
jgi:hypothetical protein